MSLLARCRDAVYRKVTGFVERAFWVEGTLSGTDQTFRSLFIGNSQTMRSLLPRMYGGEHRILRKQWIWIPSLERLVARDGAAFDLCIAVIPLKYDGRFSRLCDFRGQQSVRQVVDVPSSWDELKSKLHRNARDAARLIRKSGLTCRLSKDPADLRFFYDRMFVPHTRERYGDAAAIEPFEEMETFFAKGFLLLVEEGGQPIAGSLCLMDDRVLTYRRMGVLDADEAHIRKGAQMAVYHFSLQLAIERGIRQFDLMKSSAFLNDGVYQHKRKWGATTNPDDEAENWVYFFTRGTPDTLAAFFRQHPVVVHTPDGLKGVVGLDRGEQLSPELTTELTDRYRAPGLEGLLVMTSGCSSPQEIGFRTP